MCFLLTNHVLTFDQLETEWMEYKGWGSGSTLKETIIMVSKETLCRKYQQFIYIIRNN